MKTERFHLGDVLSMTTGMLLSPSRMDGVYRIAQHITGEPLLTHQLGWAITESKPHLLAQFPSLSTVSGEGVTPENAAEWLAARVAEHGEWLDVAPLPVRASSPAAPREATPR